MSVPEASDGVMVAVDSCTQETKAAGGGTLEASHVGQQAISGGATSLESMAGGQLEAAASSMESTQDTDLLQGLPELQVSR